MGIQRIQESAAAMVLATILGVVIVPVFPVTGKGSTAARRRDR
jgi:hypothetical protein